jgi:hypothetical protein
MTPEDTMSKAYAIALALLFVAGCDGQHNLGSVEHGSKQACGGITGAQCPVHEICIDDPNDSCDPKAGGADCAGTCRKPTGPQCSPTLPSDAVCDLILCGGGYKVINGKTTCECCDSCPEVYCAFDCPDGYKTDANGCNLCQCKDPPGKCQGANPAGCSVGGCPTGQKCDTNAGCAPSACSCDAATGQWICTADCGGGKCVPDGTICNPVVCALACQYGFKKDANGCEICACNPPPSACGNVTCAAGEVCCNASCGICTPPGGACIQIACDNRTPVSGGCARNANHACNSDLDCKTGGCGAELCYNPQLGGGPTACDCTQPTGFSCGCVNNKCTWWK